MLSGGVGLVGVVESEDMEEGRWVALMLGLLLLVFSSEESSESESEAVSIIRIVSSSLVGGNSPTASAN